MVEKSIYYSYVYVNLRNVWVLRAAAENQLSHKAVREYLLSHKSWVLIYIHTAWFVFMGEEVFASYFDGIFLSVVRELNMTKSNMPRKNCWRNGRPRTSIPIYSIRSNIKNYSCFERFRPVIVHSRQMLDHCTIRPQKSEGELCDIHTIMTTSFCGPVTDIMHFTDPETL